ncbi:small acid-soluble spore protein SspJ, partial [Bacillus altitudinis]
LEEASKELAGDPLQEAVQKKKNNHQLADRKSENQFSAFFLCFSL